MLAFHLSVFLSALPLCFCVDLTYYVEEGKSPGTYLGDIASDSHVADKLSSQDAGLITYSQMEKSTSSTLQLFRIAKKTGKLYTAQTLDAESLCTYNMECFKMVDVAIRKEESFIKILEVKIIIKDINDHQPEFPEQQVEIEFSEESPKGAKRSIPHAIDKDVGTLNSQINYQLKKNIDEPFNLSVSKSVDGISKLSISLVERLDREVKNTYDVQVIAQDGGSPARQNVLDVHITVTDVNDNTPVFSQKVYNVTIRYEHDRSTPVTILSARDLDSGKNGEISYQFSSKTATIARSYFDLDSVTGEIFQRKKFTAGKSLVYKLYIEATDKGDPPLSSVAMVVVNVISQQNNAPTIDINFVSASTGNTASISEDIAVGSFIAFVRVTDDDAGQNGEVKCELNHSKFQLQSLGTKKYKVSVKNLLDREMQDHHEITITCQDKGSPPLFREIKISIRITDVNDVHPQFSKELFKFRIKENQKSKFPVGYVNVTDPDQGSGSKLSYSLVSNSKHFLPFIISNNGLISTVMSLDYEFQNNYEFLVLVEDHGMPSLNNTVKVIVEVKDENDNAPYFTFPSINPCTMDVTYYQHQSSNITVLKASDRDSRENAFLRYEITNGNNKQLFTINHYTGLLSFTRVVTHQDAGPYELAFAVMDSGTPVMSATTNLTLVLTVSNKTSNLLNVMHRQTSGRIHIHLLIGIVLIGVTVAVPITAAVSICLIRWKNKKNSLQRGGENISEKHITEQRHLMCHAHPDMPWPDVQGNRTEPELGHNSHSTKSKRGIYPGDQLEKGQRCSVRGMKCQNGSAVIYQGCVKGLVYIPPSSYKPIGTQAEKHCDDEDCYAGYATARLSGAELPT